MQPCASLGSWYGLSTRLNPFGSIMLTAARSSIMSVFTFWFPQLSDDAMIEMLDFVSMTLSKPSELFISALIALAQLTWQSRSSTEVLSLLVKFCSVVRSKFVPFKPMKSFVQEIGCVRKQISSARSSFCHITI